MNLQPQSVADYQEENCRLVTAIADALAAMDRGEYGTARQILRTGRASTVKPTTKVIAIDGGRT